MRDVATFRSKNTGIERLVFRELRARGVHFSRHFAALPGKPDIVFKRQKVAVFIDGDFWHGWRFPRWCAKASALLEGKNRDQPFRDQKNFRCLRRNGWTVVRVWEHDVEADLAASRRSNSKEARCNGGCLRSKRGQSQAVTTWILATP